MNAVEILNTAIADEKKARKKRRDYIKEHTKEFARIAEGITVLDRWIIRMSFDTSSLDISIAGDSEVFKGLWGALRKLGYGCHSPPKETIFSSWSGWFYPTETGVSQPGIWISFSSTKCTRKKIGTKMVEKDVFEIVCEEGAPE